jgi:uncharacterized membrane protein YsdA (DUF1294 family)
VTPAKTVSDRKRQRPVRVRNSASISRRSRTESAPTSSAAPLIVTSLFVLIIVAGTLAGRLPPVISGIYGGISVITYLLYWHDKTAAQRGNWRTKESTLLFLGLLGGWPGAVVAQQALRHKTRKQSFQWAFWGTVVLNSIVLGWLFTSSGSSLARRIGSGLIS